MSVHPLRAALAALLLAAAGPSPALADSGAAPVATDTATEASDTGEPADSGAPPVLRQDAPSDGAEARVVPTGGRTGGCDHRGPGPRGALGLLAGLGLLAIRRRRGHAALGLGAAAVVATLAAPPARAQEVAPLLPGLNAQTFEPTGVTSGFAFTPTARQLAKGRFGVDLVGSYAWRPLQASVDVGGVLLRARQQEGKAIEHLGAAHLRLAVGATDWFQLSASMPVIQGFDTGPGLDRFGGFRTDTVGTGDLTVELAFRPNGEDRAVGIAIVPFVTAPTGTPNDLLTHRVPTFGGRVALSGTAEPVHLAAHAGYRVKWRSSTLSDVLAIDDEVLYGAGAGVYLYPDAVRLNAEIAGRTTVGPGRAQITPTAYTEPLHTNLEAVADLLVHLDNGLGILVGGGAGLTPAPGAPGARGFLGLSYAPRVPTDSDGDGVPDRDDACRDAPEDLDGFQDEDGCPDPDDDGDGVPDVDDRCPDEAEDLDGFEDDDGCPDRDDDRDRIADEDDACPQIPEDPDGFEDEDGCPDVDNDGDGLLDLVDACPDQPEDVDGFSDEDGCPETEEDRDADGVIDAWDPCPDDPEDVDLFQDDDGCPDPDNDGDGIPDVDDLCRDVPEEINGYLDEDGCPDETRAVLSGDRIVILDRVLFYVNEARIRPESYLVLDAVVATMQANPQVRRVRIEGHTDSQGGDRYNQELSESRALAVRDYLIEAGVSPSRLLARGFGEIYPIASNRTEEGREQNRRVEFVVVEQATPGASPAPVAPPAPTPPPASPQIELPDDGEIEVDTAAD